MRMLTQDLFAVLFGETLVDEGLVHALASDPDCHAELMRLAMVLAELPGDGARAAEARLDALFDAVSRAVADNTTLCWPTRGSANELTDSAANPLEQSDVLKSIDKELLQLDDPYLTVVRLIAAGDRMAALVELVRHFGDTVYKLCLLMSHDHELADDETLHLFEQTYRALQETVARGREPSQCKGYFRDQLIARTRILAAAPAASSPGSGRGSPPSWKVRLFEEFAPGGEQRKSST